MGQAPCHRWDQDMLRSSCWSIQNKGSVDPVIWSKMLGALASRNTASEGQDWLPAAAL